jgi:glycosyltransferase involved in cell wall biosynthesis
MVPATLHRAGALAALVTDFWMTPSSPARMLAPRLRDRHHPALDDSVIAFNASALMFELRQSLAGGRGWDRIQRRNDWFQSRAHAALEELAGQSPGQPRVLFCYSYAARRLFEFARSRGWTTVLGQIDPGLADELMLEGLQAAHPGVERGWTPAPAGYWRSWREEIALADRVIVNSAWSRRALIDEGVGDEKLVTIPLAYEPPAEASRFERAYPDRFTADRPLRVLFLGQVSLRKGILAVIEAAARLRDQPVEFWIVGAGEIRAAGLDRTATGVRWMGRVRRGLVAPLYRDADVFLFPTLSDGFGLTQLEAQAWRLPVIATANCGDVVRDGINGVLLKAGSGDEIAQVLKALVADPTRLAAMSRASAVDDRFRPERLAASLVQAVSAS